MTNIQLKIEVFIEKINENSKPQIPYNQREEYSREELRIICETLVQPFTIDEVQRVLANHLKRAPTRWDIGRMLRSESWVVKEGRWFKDNGVQKHTFYRVTALAAGDTIEAMNE